MPIDFLADSATYNNMLKFFNLGVPDDLPVDRIHVTIIGPSGDKSDTYMMSYGDTPRQVISKITDAMIHNPDIERKLSYIVCKGSPIVSYILGPTRNAEDVEIIYDILFSEHKHKTD